MSEPEASSPRRFFAWAKGYMFWYGPRAGENGEMACRLARVQLWDRLRPILRDMAKDLTTAGVDPSDIFRLSGVIAAINTIPTKDVELLLDNVQILANRLELIKAAPDAPASGQTGATIDPWVLVELADCKVHRGTMGNHAKSPETTGVRKTGHGKYEIRKSRLADYLEVRHRQKYGVE